MSPAPTIVDVEPIYLDNASLVIESFDFAAAASKIECTPSISSATFKGMKRNAKYTHSSVDSWSLGIDFAQDYATATSFSNFLHENAGDQVTVVFAPIAGGQEWEVLVQLVPGGIGGSGGAHATSSIALGVIGEPRKVAAGAGS